MEHTVEKLSGNKVKISFKAPAADFEQAIEKAYHKMRGRINVPGFRKGKAPRRLIESMYGESIFYDDALELLFPEAYMTAVEQNDLKPVGRPEVDVQEMEKGKDLAFSCEVFVMPDVTLGEYKGVTVTRKVRKVTSGEVDARIAQEQKRVARSVDVTDRPLENGDKAELDYSGSVDGEKFAGGTAEHQTLMIGSGSFIPGFEEQMIGMTIGEERDLSVTFPEEYGAKELAGKAAIFDVTVQEVKRKILAELNDDFAQDVSECQTMEELRAELSEKLTAQAKEKAKAETETKALEKALEVCEVEVPDSMVDVRLDQLLDNFIRQISRQGIGFEQYLQLTGSTAESVRDNFKERAVTELKTELVLEAIANAEDIEADDAALEEEYARLAEQTQKSVEEIKEIYGSNSTMVDSLKFNIRVTGAIKVLVDNAKIK